MNLDDWRSRINDLDNQILDLLTQRAEAALQIGDLKRRQDAPSYAPEREADIVRRLTEQNDGPLAAEAVVAVWREILSGCRALEAALTVAYLGPQATFTHEAALQHFGAAATYRPARPIVEVFDDVERGRADFGVVPVENSTEGAVNVTLDRLIVSDALICGELKLEITQHLLSRARELGEGKRVVSHPQALAQCRGWLAEHLVDVATEEPLARDGINLTKIESRPARQSPWEYVIFVDLEGHRETHQIAAVLREMGERTLFLKVLGSYPAA